MRRLLSKLYDRFTDWLILDEITPLQQAAQHIEELTLAQVERELAAQARLPHYRRDPDLISFLLDMRTALGPAPGDGELLPIRLRYAYPVTPGGAS